MLHSALVGDLVSLSPNKRKDDMFPADFPPKVIRQAMAKGFSLDDIVAVMRGLKAQRKNVEDSELVLLSLQNRSPLMINPWTSERILRETRISEKATFDPVVGANEIRKTFRKKLSAKRQMNAFVSENLLSSVPGGMNAPIARLLLVAGLRCYDPRSHDGKGRFVACDGRNSDVFRSVIEYVLTILASLFMCQIRLEQQVMEAIKPFIHILLKNRCYTAYDILYNVRGIDNLLSWNIPGPLAKNIYSVIQEIHQQSTHVSKRNIVKEARISTGFERFLKNRAVERDQIPATYDTPAEALLDNLSSRDDQALTQLRTTLETEVLGLRLHDKSAPASELLFKAAFMVDEEATAEGTTYESFLQRLLTLRAAGNIETMKQLIAIRVDHAKTIMDGHADIFKLFGVASVSDLLKDNLGDMLIRNQALQDKVNELLEPIVDVNRKTLKQPNHTTIPIHHIEQTKHYSLSPLIRHGKTVIDSLDGDSSSIICNTPTSTQ
ncbi:unnamed protein product [Phytophthora fragariaefolia]|uniref:Unnamed protein product n=1 Tax=Phytophthora fragariaefolia TaxID=1490495 RepID=A0A9W6Y6H3_9STRA|nr:unnamed protein product [Phytophthora fragariaefolia]